MTDETLIVLNKLLRNEAKKAMEVSLTHASNMEFQEASHHAGIALGLTKASEIVTIYMRQP